MSGCGKPCGCSNYRAHLLSVGFSSNAMPTRRAQVAATTAKESVLSRDLDAYKRMVNSGIQPRSVDGSAHVEATATSRFHAETGINVSDTVAAEAAVVKAQIG